RDRAPKLLLALCEFRSMPIVPRRFDQDASQMRVARFRNSTASVLRPARVFCENQEMIRHLLGPPVSGSTEREHGHDDREQGDQGEDRTNGIGEQLGNVSPTAAPSTAAIPSTIHTSCILRWRASSTRAPK